MGQEFELKFSATRQQQAELAREYGDFTAISMETTYYDTPDGQLSARHITLRRRLENGVSVCTVKTPMGGGSRGEWETECDDIAQAIPMLCKLGCSEDLNFLTAGGIVPICGARFTRLAKTLTLAQCTVELALDAGVLLGGGQEIPLCEVEVELKAGSQAAAVAFANALSLRYGLKPEGKSKFRRALNLAKGASRP